LSTVRRLNRCWLIDDGMGFLRTVGLEPGSIFLSRLCGTSSYIGRADIERQGPNEAAF
jgi:hypothetical protein